MLLVVLGMLSKEFKFLRSGKAGAEEKSRFVAFRHTENMEAS
jgi:hypothetical protein